MMIFAEENLFNFCKTICIFSFPVQTEYLLILMFMTFSVEIILEKKTLK